MKTTSVRRPVQPVRVDIGQDRIGHQEAHRLATGQQLTNLRGRHLQWCLPNKGDLPGRAGECLWIGHAARRHRRDEWALVPAARGPTRRGRRLVAVARVAKARARGEYEVAPRSFRRLHEHVQREVDARGGLLLLLEGTHLILRV